MKKLILVPDIRIDPRWFQILFLLTFLSLGIGYLGWTPEVIKYFILLVTCLGVQFFFIRVTGGDINTLKSALITVLGLSLLLKSHNLYAIFLAGTVAISSKFLFKWKGKHFFNPANIGIIAVILITKDAWVSPGQWGREAILLFSFMALGLMVVQKVGRWDTTFTFLITLTTFNLIRWNLILGWPMDVLIHKMLNGTLLLFSFFMITDPRTIPDHKGARICWTILVAGLTFYITNFLNMGAGPIWALFFLSPLSPVFDYFFKAKRFEWLDSHIKK